MDPKVRELAKASLPNDATDAQLDELAEVIQGAIGEYLMFEMVYIVMGGARGDEK